MLAYSRGPPVSSAATMPIKPVDIDALYGLEPVFEPGREPGREPGSEGYERFVELSCPYCGESAPIAVDLSAGSQSYIEDCQVCCQPMTVILELDDRGRFQALRAERLDQ